MMKRALVAALLLLSATAYADTTGLALRGLGLRLELQSTLPDNCNVAGRYCLWSPLSGPNAGKLVWHADGVDTVLGEGGGGGGASTIAEAYDGASSAADNLITIDAGKGPLAVVANGQENVALFSVGVDDENPLLSVGIVDSVPFVGVSNLFAASPTFYDPTISGTLTGSNYKISGTYGLEGTPKLRASIGIENLYSGLLEIGSNNNPLAAIAANRIKTYANTVGHLVPDVAADTFALLAATQTLTNKTIDGSSNTLSNIAQSSVTGLSTALSGLLPLAGGTMSGPITLSGTQDGTYTLGGTPTLGVGLQVVDGIDIGDATHRVDLYALTVSAGASSLTLSGASGSLTVSSGGGQTQILSVATAIKVMDPNGVGFQSQSGHLYLDSQNNTYIRAGGIVELQIGGSTRFSWDSAGIPEWRSSANVQTTVGAAGGASALPATPAKYLKVKDDAGNTYVVPVYNPS